MKNPLRKIRLVYQRTSLPVKCIVLAALVICTIALMALRFALQDAQNQLADARAKAQMLEQENRRLEKSISQLGTVQSIQELSKELLGLVDPDTVIFNIGG